MGAERLSATDLSSAKLADLQTTHEAQQLLHREAWLLDNWRLDEWLELLTEDCTYVVPTPDLPSGDPASELTLINDNLVRLRARVVRLKSRRAHREYPWSRTRRTITNILVLVADGADELDVVSNFIVHRFRSREKAVYVGEYKHRLRRAGDGWKISHRRATLDLESLSEHGAVSVIL